MSDQPTMAALQEASYGEGRDYAGGSPHLTHASIRDRIDADLTELVRNLTSIHGRCRVLEVGAGHGTFTEILVDAGAQVTVTEMSEPSADVLRRRFDGDERVDVVHDPEADQGEALVTQGCELIVFVSVLHHIPDYVGVVGSLVQGLAEGGAFYSTQDPIWHPDRARSGRLLSKAAYLLWRLPNGNYRRGAATRLRRARGVFDESSPSDMVEYHAVRSGVDQKALVQMLAPLFETVELRTYWSTQSGVLQWLGERTRLRSDFALRATRRRSAV